MAQLNLKVNALVNKAENDIQQLINKFNGRVISLNIRANLGSATTGLKAIADSAKLATLNSEKLSASLKKANVAGKNNISKQLKKQMAPFKLDTAQVASSMEDVTKAIEKQTSTQVKEGAKQAKAATSSAQKQINAEKAITNAKEESQKATEKATKSQKKAHKEVEKLEKESAKVANKILTRETQARNENTRSRAYFKKNKSITEARRLQLDSERISATKYELMERNSALTRKVKNGETLTAQEISNANKYADDMARLNNQQKLVTASAEEMARSLRDVANESIAYDKIGSRLTEYYTKYGTQLKKNSALMNEWQTLYNKAMSGDFASVTEANQKFAQFRLQARAAGVEIDSFGSKLERTFGSRVRSAMAGYGVFAMQSAMRDLLRNAIEVDTAMTELRKVTDATSSEYAQFLTGAADRAQKLGATLSETVNATAD